MVYECYMKYLIIKHSLSHGNIHFFIDNMRYTIYLWLQSFTFMFPEIIEKYFCNLPN